MRKYINLSFTYAILAIICGVFYREFTKILGFTGRTTLAFTHLHFFVLGTIVFLIIASFVISTDLESQKQFKTFLKLYNIGLPFMITMFFVRGITQVLGTDLSKAMSASISGVSGIAHTIMTIAIVMLFLALRKTKVNQSLAK